MYRKLSTKITHIVVIVVLLVSSLILINTTNSDAFTSIESRYDLLSNPNPGAPSIHSIGFDYTNTTTPVGSVAIQFCANSPLNTDPCNMPTGLDLSGMTLASQSGEVGFTASTISSNEILLSRNPSDPVGGASKYVFDNIINPTSSGEYYVKISTYSSMTGSQSTTSASATADAISDDSPLMIQFGGIAFAITPGLTVDTVVPPYITFCAGISISDYNCGSAAGNQIDFGNFSDKTTSSATSQFLVATNFANGYNVAVDGPTLTSGNNTIAALTNPAESQVGKSQFGLNLTSNTSPLIGNSVNGPGQATVTNNYSIPDNYLFNDGDVLATSTTASNYNRFTVTYIVNVSKDQAGGVYATSLNYIAMGNF